MPKDPNQTTDQGDPAPASAWEARWAGIDGTPGEIVWDADPGDLEADLTYFAGPSPGRLPGPSQPCSAAPGRCSPQEAASYFADVIQRHGLPPGLAKVMRQIPPGHISLPQLVGLFPAGQVDVPGTGIGHIHAVNTLPGDEVIMVPAICALIRPRGAG